MLRVEVLGPVRVSIDGAEVADLRPASRALLSRLALADGRSVSAEQLIDDLWDLELPSNPASALRIAVSRTRKGLGNGDLLVWNNGGYRLDGADVDAHEFDSMVTSGRRAVASGEHREAARQFADALALWRGGALTEIDAPFASAHAVRLESERLAVLEQRIAADLACGRHADLIAELDGLIELHPFQERLWAHRMVALYRAGRQADALRTYAAIREQLADELGLEPGPELRNLEQLVLNHSSELDVALPAAVVGPAVAPVPPEPRRLALPLSGLIGRERDLDGLSRMIDEHRLVSLVGPAGVGKTRLALEAAAIRQQRGASEVWVVELAPTASSESIHEAIAAQLGGAVAAQGNALSSLADRLDNGPGLLVLDNCEQVRSDAAAVVEQMLHALPGLRIVVTSRIPLGIDVEQMIRLAPLPIGEAVTLFATRAGKAAEVANPDAVLAICESLDGLPLAVELAAGLTRTLTVDQIAARLGDRFRLLTVSRTTAAPHHRTLRAALQWGHDLLADDDRVLFRRLATFAGGWTLEAAEEVCAGGVLERGSVAPCLARLVDASLVSVVNVGGAHRFVMLETMRHFAEEQLSESQDSDAVRARHASWCLALVERTEQGSPADIDELKAEFLNVRAAIESSVGTERSAIAAYLLIGVERVWLMQGHLADGRRLLRQLADDESLPAVVRAELYNHAGNHCLHAGHFDDADHALALGLQLARVAEDSFVLAESLYFGGILDLQRARLDAARDSFTEVLAIMRQIGRRSGIGAALDCLADVADLGDDHAAAVRYRDEAEVLDRELDEPERLATGLVRRAIGAVFAGEIAEAEVALAEALAIAEVVASPMLTAWSMEAAGRVATARGDVAAARRSHGAALAAYAEIGTDHDVCAVRIDLAAAAHDAGDLETAAAELCIALPQLVERRVDRFVADGLDVAAAVLASRGDDESAAHVWGTLESFRRRHGLVSSQAARTRFDQWSPAVRERLGEQWSMLCAAAEGRPLAIAARVAMDRLTVMSLTAPR